MNLTNIEKETIVLFNEGEDTAEIYTFNKKLISKIRKKCQQHPDIFKIIKEDNHGGVTCQLPKKRLSVVLTSPPTLENSLQVRKEQKKGMLLVQTSQLMMGFCDNNNAMGYLPHLPYIKV